MDAIDRAIAKGKHISSNPVFIGMTWADFEASARNKIVVLYGVGAGADFYYYKYKEEATATIIIDQNETMHGQHAYHYLLEELSMTQQCIKVSSHKVLKTLPGYNTVVLITSLMHYDEIASVLEAYHIHNYFSVLCMEAAYRKKHDCFDMVDRKQLFLDKCSHLPINNNKVCIYTTCDGVGHCKEIVKQLIRLRIGLDIIWLVHDMQSTLPDGVRPVWVNDFRKYHYEKATAKIWISDYAPGAPPGKRHEQYYVEVKHWSSITLKMFGYDEARYRHDEKMLTGLPVALNGLDFVLVGSDFDERTCRSGFSFSGEVIHVGSPRSDVLFRGDEGKSIVLKAFPHLIGKKLLLYAPTFRLTEKGWDEIVSFVDLDYAKARNSLEKRFGGEWRILLRLHPLIAEQSKGIHYPSYVVDVSSYPDVEELVSAADSMITDYSSVMFEPAHIRRPVFLLATDREQFLKEQRGFLLDYESLPFPIAATNDELATNIENFDYKKYVHNVDDFMKRYGVNEDGHAGERAAQFILDLIDGKRN